MEININNVIENLNITTKGNFLRPCDVKKIKERVNLAIIDAVNNCELSEGTSINIDTLVKKVSVFSE